MGCPCNAVRRCAADGPALKLTLGRPLMCLPWASVLLASFAPRLLPTLRLPLYCCRWRRPSSCHSPARQGSTVRGWGRKVRLPGVVASLAVCNLPAAPAAVPCSQAPARAASLRADVLCQSGSIPCIITVTIFVGGTCRHGGVPQLHGRAEHVRFSGRHAVAGAPGCCDQCSF